MEDETWDNGPAGGNTLTELLDRYEREVTPSKKSATQEHYQIRALQRSPLGDVPISEIHPKDVASWRDKRLQEVKPSTVLRYLALLSEVFNHARKEWGIAITNPVADIRKPTPGRARDRRISQEEEEAILKAADEHSNPEFTVIIRLALHTAMRQGEIISLRWENLDFERRVALLPDTKNGESRGVPMSTKAIEALSRLKRGKEGVVFHYTRDGFRTVWRRHIISLGIRDLTFHDFRHEATSRLVEHGLDMMEVAAITGHKTLGMLKRYTHLKAELLAKKLP
jgi:integrase